MYKLTVKLKQHTPLIHFQHEQHGATLRATELKPKLDRFLIKKLGITNGNIPKKYEDWFISTDKMALDYKVRIIADKDRTEQVRVLNDNRTAIWLKNIELNVSTFNSELYNFLTQQLETFFVLSGFGTRQSKGYGFFTLANTSNIEKNLKLEYSTIFKKKLTFAQTNNWNSINAVLEEEYKLLKSGINFKVYKKAKIWEYACSKNLIWEKNCIKKRVNELRPEIFKNFKYDTNKADHLRSEKCKKTGGTYKYIRALLGLAEHFEYQSFTKNKRYVVKIDSIGTNENKIDRFKSPLTFKYFNNNLYILPEHIKEKIFDRAFKFSLFEKYGEDNPIQLEEELLKIKTPTADQFDLVEFLKKSFEKTEWTQL